jgi:hypothetical protein
MPERNNGIALISEILEMRFEGRCSDGHRIGNDRAKTMIKENWYSNLRQRDRLSPGRKLPQQYRNKDKKNE